MIEALSRLSHSLFIISTIAVLWILADLSRRLGAVRRMKDYWKLYYAAILTTIIFFVMRFTESRPDQVLYRIVALSIVSGGLLMACIATGYYWSWLWRKGTK